jgi:hypothetical protein
MKLRYWIALIAIFLLALCAVLLWSSESDCTLFAISQALAPATMLESPLPPQCKIVAGELSAIEQRYLETTRKWYDLRIQKITFCETSLSADEVLQFYNSEWKRKDFSPIVGLHSPGAAIPYQSGLHLGFAFLSPPGSEQTIRVAVFTATQSRLARLKVARTFCK